MNDIQELHEDMLVEEGNINSPVYDDAMEECFIYNTLRDYSSLLKKYGIQEVNKWLTNINAN